MKWGQHKDQKQLCQLLPRPFCSKRAMAPNAWPAGLVCRPNRITDQLSFSDHYMKYPTSGCNGWFPNVQQARTPCLLPASAPTCPALPRAGPESEAPGRAPPPPAARTFRREAAEGLHQLGEAEAVPPREPLRLVTAQRRHQGHEGVLQELLHRLHALRHRAAAASSTAARHRHLGPAPGHLSPPAPGRPRARGPDWLARRGGAAVREGGRGGDGSGDGRASRGRGRARRG